MAKLDEEEQLKNQKLFEHEEKNDDDDTEEDDDVEDYDYEKYEIGEEDTYASALKHTPHLTPFNMDDEEENDGHVDESGYFIFKKNKEQVKDNWLDSLEWENAGFKSSASRNSDYGVNIHATDDIDDKTSKLMKNNEVGHEYKQDPIRYADKLLNDLKYYFLGKMNIADCIRMYGLKDSVDFDMEKMLKVSEISDELLGCGHFSIFEYNIDTVNNLLKNSNKDQNKHSIESNNSDDTKKEDIDGQNQESNLAHLPSIQWYYKLKEDDKTTFGPFSSQQMEEMTYNSSFQNGKDCVFVSKTNEPESVFYNSKRIDFSLFV